MTPFINIQLSNQDRFVEIEDKYAETEDIHTYIHMLVGALLGLSFSEKVIKQGFIQWLEEDANRC